MSAPDLAYTLGAVGGLFAGFAVGAVLIALWAWLVLR